MKEVQRRLRIFITLFCIVTVIGTIGFMVLEELSFTDAFYYNIVTMSTVGYGDIHPTNQTSRMLAILLIVMGGATFLGVIANATEILILKREAQTRIKKLNMVLGIFFTEAGYKLLKLFSGHDNINNEVKKHLIIGFNWSDVQFINAIKTIKKYKIKIDTSDLDFKELKAFLASKRDFLLGLLENPVLIEHEGFSDSLLSVFHVLDELSNRNNLNTLPEPDIKHLTNDMNRAYKNLIVQWITYMKHLKKEYPYLFSLAMRTNPFDENASPVIVE